MNLEKEFEFYLANQLKLVEKYNGRFLVIKDQEVKGNYQSQGEAYEEGKKMFDLGTFLIQHCISGSQSYTHVFNSRVILNSIAF